MPPERPPNLAVRPSASLAAMALILGCSSSPPPVGGPRAGEPVAPAAKQFWARFVAVGAACALTLVVMSACDGDADQGVDADVALQPPDAQTPQDAIRDYCNPIAQTGCSATERCTWRRVAEPTVSGPVCTQVGDRELGDSCVVDEVSGLDDCGGGLFCYNFQPGSPVCEKICDTIAVGICGSGSCMPLAELGSNIDGLCVP